MNRRSFLEQFTAVCSLASISGCLDQTLTQGGSSTDKPHTPDTVNSPTTDPDMTNDDKSNIYFESNEQQWVVTTGDQTIETRAFTLHNQLSQPFTTNQGAWTISQQTEDGWSEIDAGDGSDEITIAPKTTHTWSLSLQPHPTSQTSNSTNISSDLSEGTYLFRVVGNRQGNNHSQRTECQTRFDLVKK